MENKNSLQVTNIQYAHEQYDSFVDIRFEMLNISDFKQRRVMLYFIKKQHICKTQIFLSWTDLFLK